MTRKVYLYLSGLSLLTLGWLGIRSELIVRFAHRNAIMNLLAVIALYLASHICRMLRLTLLTLDERDKIFPLVTAHALTAFPSSFLPFKLGEILRLLAFFHVFDGRSKAFVVWLAERLGDVVVLTVLTIGLQIFGVELPPAMRVVFAVFAVASAFVLIGLFAVAKIFVYLNRHLVLTSSSTRGLKLLGLSHALRTLEVAVYEAIEGRVTAFLMLSVLIWMLEIVALSSFIHHFTQDAADFAELFTAAMFASLPGGTMAGASAFGFYQSAALVVVTVIFLFATFVPRLKNLSR